MTKYQEYLFRKYGSTEIKSRFQIAKEAQEMRDAEEKRRKELENKR